MALVLTVEDGSGIAGANSYASVADADGYAEAHVDGAAWIAAITANKERALVMATRLLDFAMNWKGTRVNANQALAWPRDDFEFDGLIYDPEPLPSGLIFATCELARILLASGDITKKSDKDDVKAITIGPVKIELRENGIVSNTDRANDILPASVLMILDGFGKVETQSFGVVKLIRS